MSQDTACHSSVALIGSGDLCGNCEHARSCLEGAQGRLDLLPDTPHLSEPRMRIAQFASQLGGTPEKPALTYTVSRRGIARRELTPGEQQAIAALPARVRKTAERLAQTGWFDHVRRQVSRGLPIGAGQGSASMLLQRLLLGPARRPELVAQFASELGIKPSSAQVEVSSAIVLLEHARIAVFRSGSVSLRPSNEGHYDEPLNQSELTKP